MSFIDSLKGSIKSSGKRQLSDQFNSFKNQTTNSLFDSISQQSGGLFGGVGSIFSENTTSKYFKKLNSNSLDKNSLKYPINLENEGNLNIIVFNVNARKGSKFKNEGEGSPVSQTSGNTIRSNVSMSSETVRTTDTISLYMPSNISYQYNANWESVQLGVMGRVANTLGSSDITSAQITNALGESSKSSFAKSIQSLTSLNTKDLKDFASGVVVNPYMEIMFRGLENRTFQFEFHFTPKSESEAIEVQKIINTFKLHQAPELKINDSNSYWIYPSEFDISFLNANGENNWISKIGTCAMTGCNVTYGSEASFAVHGDGSPVETRLSLEFMELELLTKERISQGY